MSFRVVGFLVVILSFFGDCLNPAEWSSFVTNTVCKLPRLPSWFDLRHIWVVILGLSGNHHRNYLTTDFKNEDIMHSLESFPSKYYTTSSLRHFMRCLKLASLSLYALSGPTDADTISQENAHVAAETKRRVWLQTKLVLRISPNTRTALCQPGELFDLRLAVGDRRRREFLSIESVLTGHCILTNGNKDSSEPVKQVKFKYLILCWSKY